MFEAGLLCFTQNGPSRAQLYQRERETWLHVNVLLWINGPFGVGKTQVSFELHRRLTRSFVSDPEHFGSGLHRMLPVQVRGDFQDISLWRTGVCDVLDMLLSSIDGVVIVPMTVTSRDYHCEILGRLEALGHQVHHFSLIAEPQTLRKRLRSRGAGNRGFAATKIQHCVDALHQPEFKQHVPTDGRSIGTIAEDIAAQAGLELDSSASRLAQLAHQWRVRWKHVRFD